MNMNNYKKEIKVALWAFVFSFVFSIGIGLVVGNPFAISFIRAFISAVLFSVVIFGVMYIVKKYLPELSEISNSSDMSLKDGSKEEKVDLEGKGTKIDYVVGADAESGKYKDINEDKKESEGEKKSFKEALSNIKNKDEVTSKEQIEKDGKLGDETLPDENNEEELPPIEELLNEEEDTVPENEIEEKLISNSEKKIGGSYIKVGDVNIPNEPEIIAKAIKKVMKEDE